MSASYRYVARRDGTAEEMVRGSTALAALNEWVRRLNALGLPWSTVEVGIGSGERFEAFQRRSK